jgi:hypothetical protein
VLRWLVAILTIVVLAGRGVTAFAAAGIQIDVKCCCPDPQTCKCHHDGGESETIKKCSGAFHEMLPQLAETTLPTQPASAVERCVQRIATIAIAPLSDIPPREPETPPF